MRSCELYVARHGQTEWNKLMRWQGLSDIPLNELGVSQAKILGLALKNQGITRIFSSDLKRARQTAEIVAETLGIGPVVLDARLRERFLGKFEGWQSKDAARYLGIPEEEAYILETNELAIDNVPDVELWTEFVSRIWDAVRDITDGLSGQKILMVAHGGVMRAITVPLTPSANEMPDYSNGQYVRLRSVGAEWFII